MAGNVRTNESAVSDGSGILTTEFELSKNVSSKRRLSNSSNILERGLEKFLHGLYSTSRK